MGWAEGGSESGRKGGREMLAAALWAIVGHRYQTAHQLVNLSSR